MKPRNLIFTLYLTGLMVTAPACNDEVEPDNLSISDPYTLDMDNLLI